MAEPSVHLRRVAAAAAQVEAREGELAAARERLTAAIVAAHLEGGESLSAVARAAGVSRQWVARLVENAGG
jgi:hypothetical protein